MQVDLDELLDHIYDYGMPWLRGGDDSGLPGMPTPEQSARRLEMARLEKWLRLVYNHPDPRTHTD